MIRDIHEHQIQLYFRITNIEIRWQHTARRCGTWVRVVSTYERSCVEVIIVEWKWSPQHCYCQHYTNVSGQQHTPVALPLLEQQPVTTGCGTGWDAEPVWAQWKENLSASDGNRTRNPRSSSPQYGHYIHLWSLVRNLRVQEPENNVKSDRKPRTVSSCVSVWRRVTTGDTWFGIKEASAAYVSVILSTLKDYTSGIKHMMNFGT